MPFGYTLNVIQFLICSCWLFVVMQSAIQFDLNPYPVWLEVMNFLSITYRFWWIKLNIHDQVHRSPNSKYSVDVVLSLLFFSC